MKRNVYVMIVVSILFGLSLGIYDFILPFYLESRGVPKVSMGYIFAAGALVPFFLRIGVGGWSDAVGRKLFYWLSIFACAAANALSPVTINAWLQACFKSVRDSATEVRAVLHSVLLYENSRQGFIESIGKTQGAEKIVESLGYPIGGGILAMGALAASGLEYSVAFFFSALMLVAATLIFSLMYREAGGLRNGNNRPSLRDFFSLNLNKKLWVIILASLVFYLGLGCSHSFNMNLFFVSKFHCSKSATSVILMFHRMLLGLPMIFAGIAIRGNYKALYITFMAVEGALIVGGGLIPNFWLATGVWLLHDFLGAGIWIPIQSELIQRYSRASSRALDVAKVIGLSSITLVPGHIMAGYLTSISCVTPETAISMPFIVGGALIGVSAAVLLFL